VINLEAAKTLRILWLTFILSATIVYFAFGWWLLIIITPLGLLVWWLMNKITLSEKTFEIWFRLFKYFFKGEHFLLKGKMPEKLAWKEVLFTESIDKSFLPVLFMFGIINYAFRYLNIQTPEQALKGPLIILLGFSTVVVFIAPYLWVLIDSKWFFYDKKSNKIINVGEQLLIYFRGIAGATIILSLIATIVRRFGIYNTVIFLIVSFIIGGAPIFLTIILYIKYFHYKFVKKLRQHLLNKKLPILEIQTQPAKITCPYCGARNPLKAKFCIKCGASLEYEPI